MSSRADPGPGIVRISVEPALDPQDFVDVLNRSGLGERRPVDDPVRVSQMLEHANLTLTARDGEALIGVARSLTDFAYVCYCADLAVDRAYQGRGVGRALLRETRARLHPQAKLYLRAAPGAITYYEHLGLPRFADFFAILPETTL